MPTTPPRWSARSPDLDRLMQDIHAVTDLLDARDDGLIRMISARWPRPRAMVSDVHLESFETHSVVRLPRRRHAARRLVAPPALHAALISRIKIMSQLDIAEKRLPPGRAHRVGGRPARARIPRCRPRGERAVLRLLEKDAGRLKLERLGMAPLRWPNFRGWCASRTA